MRIASSSQRGDTIVEVLISIAIAGVVLAGAYVTTNRSLAATRAAQERGNALKLAESQVEKLKSLAKSNPGALFAITGPFCVASTTPFTLPDASQPACKVDGNGTPTVPEPAYRISIDRVGNTFTVKNQWVDPGGKQTNKLQLVYRAYN